MQSGLFFANSPIARSPKQLKHEYCEQTSKWCSSYRHSINEILTLLRSKAGASKLMTPQEFLENLALAETDSEKLIVFARYLDTTALDNATTSKWRRLSYSNEIQMSLNNLAFHLEALADSNSL
jgi:hypothetical protein